MPKLTDLHSDFICLGSILRLPGTTAFEPAFDLMLVAIRTDVSSLALVVATGAHAGNVHLHLPCEAEWGPDALSKRWLIDNWRTLVYPDCDLQDVRYWRRYVVGGFSRRACTLFRSQARASRERARVMKPTSGRLDMDEVDPSPRWMRLVELEQRDIARGSVFRFPSCWPYEGRVDMIIVHCPDDRSGHLLVVATGCKAGRTLVIPPAEACIQGSPSLSADWMVTNWRAWIYDECDAHNVHHLQHYIVRERIRLPEA